MQQATAFVKQLAGIRPQDEEGTEDPAATPQGEIDEVPDLNPPKKTKKTTAPKEPTRKIATRSTSKVPEDPPQPKKAQQIELDGWERLLKDVGQRPSNRAHNPEERTEAASNDRAQNKRGWPGSESNPVLADEGPTPSGTQEAAPAQGALPAWKIQETLVRMAERAMKAEENGDMALANRLYDIGAGLGQAVPRSSPTVAAPTVRGTVQAPVTIEGLRVPIPINNGRQSKGKQQQQQRRTSPNLAKGYEKGGQGGQKQSQGGYKGNRYNPRHGDRDGGRHGGRDGGRGRNY
ncbi:hypothetical protein PtA15_12A437 [Puccinia triticina]|uniref:Uncharacterized protein n=1 Tax=Puccinia triticina TaxID=208348 RepID=A0ABY7D1H8_9BASI|nr:uncharacterized protein PtA15_12A437 [Puccinia triticina]WAQ90448.1 hypothetical protein PtA15_12A437 [Puccinia triticina]